MMQKRNVYSLLLISFIAVFAASMAFANEVKFETKNVARCTNANGLITAIVSSDSISAIEVVVEISGDATAPVTFTWDAGIPAAWTKIVDDTSGVDGTLPDTIRIAAMLLSPSDGALAAGTYTVGRVNFASKDMCTGTINLNHVVFNYPAPTPVQTQFVNAATSATLAVTQTNGVISIVNQAPSLAAVLSVTLPTGSSYTTTLSGSDLDACEALTYGKVSGPGPLTVSGAGVVTWNNISGTFTCANPISVKVRDKCGAEDTVSFTITITNIPPVIACTNPAPVVLGDVVSGAVTATDADGGPYALLYKVVSFTGPGTVTINPVTGAFSWPTVYNDASYLGNFTLCVSVTDSANLCAASPANADTCCMQVTTVWGKVVIEKVHDQIQGQFTDVDVMVGTNYPIGGFDLLLFYDASALSLQKVDPGKFITDCGWEYFTYRFGANGNCGSACPSGYVRIVGMAETNNGNNHPDCFTNYPGPGIDSVVATMRFLVSNDRTLECQYVPITFWWIDCGDNAFSNTKGDSLIISRYVYGYGGFDGPYYHIESLDPVFPTNQGAQEECDIDNVPGKPETWRVIDFFNGGVDIVCADSIDARGDINLNGLSYEIADAVMFTNYFIYGFSAFTVNVDGSTAASDVNADGLALSVADLVYLIRVLVGDALPYPKDAANEFNVSRVNVVSGTGTYTVSDVEVGAVAMTVKGEAKPELLAQNMQMRYAFENGVTRIIILPQYEIGKSLTGFTGDFVRVQGEVIGEIQMSNILGQPITAKLTPKTYALDQNYPNPFNPSTTISFALPVAGNYTLTVYNVNGQVVKSFSGAAEAGWQKVVWNTTETNTASGVYFYRLEAGSFSSVKKMVLLK